MSQSAINCSKGEYEPIAIVGMGCRFPGNANDPQSYWSLLESGSDAISETPADRWNLEKFYTPNAALPGKTQSKWGGYVQNLEQFDPQLFGISPREAAVMDPQQRLLLEVAFRALEDAGQPVDRIAGQPVSVYVGISSFDYVLAGLSYQDRGEINPYSNTGGSSSIAANRLSYCFDLRGPSVAVDTACSSSLVAVHMACESLWRGEAKMALAGGVNALIMPDFYVAFSQLGVLSPDGRCKSFDARANGYVRSEGAGMVLLKPLSAAIRDRDAVYAVIRSTALNQDGRTPGMTVPSQAAQEELIRTACRKANIDPSEIQYVEAHGTGTPVGDPIEARALGSVLGENRGEGACTIGSVKANIGHLEAGAGIASLIKVGLALQHRKIPSLLHFEKPNPQIDLEALRLRVPRGTENWDSNGRRLAGINGFGYGGANAHVILEECPVELRRLHPPQSSNHRSQAGLANFTSTAETSAGEGRRLSGEMDTDAASETLPPASNDSALTAPVLMPMSARSKSALTEYAGVLANWIEENHQVNLAEVAGFLAHRRSHLNYRATCCASTATEMIDALRLLAQSAESELPAELSAEQRSKGLVFVCSGQGPQWWGMGRNLLKFSPAFRSVIKRCDSEFAKHTDWSLLQELTRNEATSRMQQTSIAQPSLFAIQVALAAVWESWGIRPTAVVGHSVGEIAAAYLSGGLSWQDACRVAVHRGRTMDLASSHGAMVAAGLSPDEVPQWIEDISDRVGIAAVNGPTSVTISGEREAIAELTGRLEDKGVFCRQLAVEYAFHSPQMEPVRDALLESLEGLKPQATEIPYISTVTGGLLDGEALGAEYWWKNVRQAVRFSDAMSYLAKDGFQVAVELGPHPVLAYAINECFQASGKSIQCVPSLNRQQDDLICISKSLGRLYELGFDLCWEGFYKQPSRKLAVPGYQFQLQYCWNESHESQFTRLAAAPHPLLGDKVDSIESVWQSRIDLRLQSYLEDHRVRNNVVYPAAAVVESSIAAAIDLQPEDVDGVRLERIQLHRACLLAEDRPQWVETRFDDEKRQLKFSFRECSGNEWQELATVGVSATRATSPEALERSRAEAIEQARRRCNQRFDGSRFYRFCEDNGLRYGPRFKGIVGGSRRDGESLCSVSLEGNFDSDCEAGHYHFHPALLDSCFHAMIAADRNFDQLNEGLFLPYEIGRIDYYRKPSQHLTVHARLLSKSDNSMLCDVQVFDAQDMLCLDIREFKSMRVSGRGQTDSIHDLIYSYSWIEQPLASTATSEPGSPRQWLLFMDEQGVGRDISRRLKTRGDSVFEIYRDQSATPQTDRRFYQIDPASLESFKDAFRLLSAEHPQLALDHVIYLWGLDAADTDDLSGALLDQANHLTTTAPMHLVQSWEDFDHWPNAELTVVTRAAQSQDGIPERTEVSQSPLIGFARVIASEYARFRTRLVDLPAQLAAGDLDNLLSELLAEDDEDEVMWRQGQRFVHRFAPHRGKPASEQAVSSKACQLKVGSAAGIEELCYETRPEYELADQEVEIEVIAAGLNFSDVMKALNLYPGLPDGPVNLGAECAGRVVRTGSGSRWQIGDEVMAVAPGSFATRVQVHEALVARKPKNLTFEQAAAIPIAFLTASYALEHCARLQSGETVLIHSASGGVGLAAMQLAKHIGATIMATAGTPEKREFVRQAGASLAMNSRNLDFADQTRAETGGEGVDVILNSLPGEAIKAGLSVLKIGGRFLEIGKRDIYGDAALGLYPFRNNLSMFAIDLDQLFKHAPAQMGRMLESLVPRFERGELQPLPVTTFPSTATVDAFRLMQQGKHIGKVVIEYEHAPLGIVEGEYAPIRLSADATYWIAGGLGGFGLQIARWLSAHGAKNLVLGGRSQQISSEAEQVVAELRVQGTRIEIKPTDITDISSVRETLSFIREQMPPLRGILHTAMVLEDCLLTDLDEDKLERVLRPKVHGGWNLHAETLDCDLDLFVVFSSLSSVFGHAGQANYAAANAFLDSLAYFRRANGLPATVVNWGHLGEVGYLAEREQLGQRLERQGVLSFSVKQATDCLEYALQNQTLQMSVLKMDWTKWRGLGITNRVSPRFAHLLQSVESPDVGNELPNGASLRSVSPDQRQVLVEQMIRHKTANLLGMPAEQIQSDRALLEMGLDSLMAVEMRNWIENQMEIDLPISALMRSSSLQQVTEVISDIIEQSTSDHDVAGSDESSMATPNPKAGSAREPASSMGDDAISEEQAALLLEELPDMDPDEVNRLLSQMLRDEE